MNEQVGIVDLASPFMVSGPGIPGIYNFATWPWRTHYVLWPNPAGATLLHDRNGFSLLDSPKQGSRGNTESHRPVPIESPRAWIFCKDISQSRRPVTGGYSLDLISLEADNLLWYHLHRMEGESDLMAEEETDILNKIVTSLGPIHGKRIRPSHEGQRLDQAQNPQEMIRMPVSDEDRLDKEPGLRPHHLLLGPLTTIEQEGVRPTANHDTGGIPIGRWHRTCGPQEVDLQCLPGYRKHLLNTR